MTILRDQVIMFGGYNLTGDSNTIGLDYGVEALDVTVFGNETKNGKAGSFTAGLGVQGFFNAVNSDKALFDSMGIENKVITVANSVDEGAVAYFMKGYAGSYDFNGTVADVAKFSMSAAASSNLIRGKVLDYVLGAGASGVSNDVNVGTVEADEKFYAALHVFNVSGTSPQLTVSINHSVDSVDELLVTFDDVSEIGAQFVELDAGLLDGDFNAEWDISGTDAEFDFVIVIGKK